MASHQKHPSIITLRAKKRVQQFRELFNKPNTNNQEPLESKQKHNKFISLQQPKKLVDVNKTRTRPLSQPSIPMDRRPLPPFLALLDEDNYASDHVDYIHNSDEETLEISATFLLSPSFVESPSLYNNTTFTLTQSTTSPTHLCSTFNFEATEDENESNANCVSELKPIQFTTNSMNRSNKRGSTKTSSTGVNWDEPEDILD
eukprot:32584_1